MKAIKIITVLLLATAMLGCKTKLTRDPAFAPVTPPMPPAAPQGNGAIYQAGFEKSWFEDDTARRVGDILVVTLEESTDGSSTNASNVSKSTSNSVSTPTLLGSPLSIGPSGATTQFALDSNHSFSGSGDQAQSNALNGTVTVMVVDVMPNGYLKVRGEKRIGLNSGNEYVKLSGIVRPADIATDNTIRSTQIADATLVYMGEGQVADASIMGWFSKFFLSSFMPF